MNEAPRRKPTLHEMLAEADARAPEEVRRLAAERDAANAVLDRVVENMIVEMRRLLCLPGFADPVVAESRRRTQERETIETDVLGHVQGGDLVAAAGARVCVSLGTLEVTVKTLQLGLQRRSTRRKVQVTLPMQKDEQGVYLLDPTTVEGAFAEIIPQLALDEESALQRRLPHEQSPAPESVTPLKANTMEDVARELCNQALLLHKTTQLTAEALAEAQEEMGNIQRRLADVEAALEPAEGQPRSVSTAGPATDSAPGPQG